jgi:uncharacterized protein DUF6788
MATRRSTPGFEATRQALANSLAEIDGVLPGSVVVRHMTCGSSGCSCKADPPSLHGPYIQWTRTKDGKTVTRYLKEEQLARYQQWFDNAVRLKELVARLEVVSVAAVEEAEGWATGTASTPESVTPKRRRPAKPST